MVWLVLLLAGLLEVVWALGLKATDGFTKLGPSVLTGTAIVASMVLLAQAARTLPIGTAYAVWVGIGAAGAAIGGVVLYEEAMPPLRAAFLGLLVLSIVGLKLTTPA
ncbi:MAG: quaternary ammonium compound efflux SMR transporter SugE [Deltaproteobacteria bacterium]|jgi:quaternary ammonium compound-resistance protein SugE|nr:quaternary ammonium compound efflux SMR transporter SugE [Deltaproteobacteria bacterium]